MKNSIKFYKDILGLEPNSPNENPETTTFYAFKTGESMLALERNGTKVTGVKTKEQNPFLLQFAVGTKEKLEEINKHLEEKGVQLLTRSKQTDWGIITNFCDPDGNKLEILCKG